MYLLKVSLNWTNVNIPDKMKIPADAPKDEYETTFKYKNLKNGQVKEFSESDYPWRDSLNWKLESSETKLIKKGYTPPNNKAKKQAFSISCGCICACVYELCVSSCRKHNDSWRYLILSCKGFNRFFT